VSAVPAALRGAARAHLGLALLLAAGAPAPAPARAAGPAARAARVTFLHVNDVYQLEPQQGRGGYAELSTLLRRERARAPHALTTVGGDFLSPSALAPLTKGAHVVELFEALGVTHVVPGNHELDFGPEPLVARTEESDFAWLAANLRDAEGRPLGAMAASDLVDAGGVRVGLFGLITAETEALSRPGPGLRFLDPVETAAAVVADLRERGADVVVALTHLSLAEDRRVAREVPGVSLILGGHEHEPIAVEQDGTLILKAGQDARWLLVARLDVTVRQDERGRRVDVVPGWTMEPVHRVRPDRRVARLVDRWNAVLAERLGEPIGRTAVELDTRQHVVRGRESAFGDLVADALRERFGADAAITNGGGIRGGALRPAGSVLTAGDVRAELPFDNVAVLLEVTGAELGAALEHGLGGLPRLEGRFPQVSGLVVRFDPARPAGGRLVSVEIGGRPLDPAATYRLATNDYLAEGGDGYAALAEARRLVDERGGELVSSLVAERIRAAGEIAPVAEGRLVAVTTGGR
jgi:2',3'-cyclic-nucleotide 2'-phosphodiesterase (5'-nucleotidase family)